MGYTSKIFIFSLSFYFRQPLFALLTMECFFWPEAEATASK